MVIEGQRRRAEDASGPSNAMMVPETGVSPVLWVYVRRPTSHPFKDLVCRGPLQRFVGQGGGVCVAVHGRDSQR